MKKNVEKVLKIWKNSEKSRKSSKLQMKQRICKKIIPKINPVKFPFQH